jgi:hypothetical protein
LEWFYEWVIFEANLLASDTGADQAKIGFMNERGRLERLSGLFACQVNGCEVEQLVVNKRQQPVRRKRIVGLDSGHDLGEFAHRTPLSCLARGNSPAHDGFSKSKNGAASNLLLDASVCRTGRRLRASVDVTEARKDPNDRPRLIFCHLQNQA